MKKCPFCAEDIPEESKVCKFCSSTVVRKCPFCAEEIVANATSCRFCRSAIPAAGAPASSPVPSGPLGAERGVVMSIVLTFLTCGIYGWVWLYKIGDELNSHQGMGRLKPGVDILLILVTCGLWGIYVMYKYPRALQEITQDEKAPVVDLTVPCLILTIFGLQIVSLAILQSELNKHWEAHHAQGT
ncbi:MAG TPA: DUF4234 domain-containing protein [Planctomycetota bacterium]